MLSAARRQLPDARAGPDQLQQLLGYHWPGNVRELRNVAERAVLGIAASAAPFAKRRARAQNPRPCRPWLPRWMRLSAPDCRGLAPASVATSPAEGLAGAQDHCTTRSAGMAWAHDPAAVRKGRYGAMGWCLQAPVSAATPAWDSHRPPVPLAAGTCAARRVAGPRTPSGVPVSKPLAFSAVCSCRVCSRDRVAGHAAIRPPRQGRRSGVATTAPRQCVVGGIVVAQDGAEVLPHQNAGPRTGGRQDGGRGQVGRALPSMARTLQPPTGQCFAARSTQPWRGQSPVAAARSVPQVSPGTQPSRTRKCAVDAATSGMLPQMSRRPSPSASTA